MRRKQERLPPTRVLKAAFIAGCEAREEGHLAYAREATDRWLLSDLARKGMKAAARIILAWERQRVICVRRIEP